MSKLLLRKPELYPALFTTMFIVVTAALGFWQIERMNWKENMIGMIEARIKAAPVELPFDIADPDGWDYRKVTLSGTFLHTQESFLQALSTSGEFGYQVITPMLRSNGSMVMINRGWVPYGNSDPSTRQAGQIDGEVEVVGVLRLPWHRRAWVRQFVVTNDPANKLYFDGALAEMAAAWDLDVAPFFVDANENANPGGLPRGGQTILTVRNMHLSYVITWFSLSIIALGVFVLYHRKREED